VRFAVRHSEYTRGMCGLTSGEQQNLNGGVGFAASGPCDLSTPQVGKDEHVKYIATNCHSEHLDNRG
jgi:hypothetical protein